MKSFARLAGPVLLAGLFLWSLSSDEILSRLRGADWRWLAACVALLLMQTVLMALRWRLLARALGLGFSIPWAVREYLVAQLVNTTLPGGVLGDGARAVRSQAAESGLKRAAQAVVLERAMGQIGLLAVFVAGLVWALLAPSGLELAPRFVRTAAVTGLALAIVAGLCVLLLRGGRIAALLALCLKDRGTILRHVALSVAAALLNVAGFAAAARAVGLALPAQAVLVLVPLILFAMVIPLTIAGWGWREGAAAALLPLAGATPGAGVAAGIVFGIAIMIAALPAVPLLLRGGRMPVQDLAGARPG